jgi:ribosomal protein S18 acetylase RimI-like enzyme
VGNTGLTDITLRDAVAADREAIVALTTLTMQEHQARLPDQFLPREKPPTAWIDYLSNGNIDEKVVPFARLIVACQAEKVVGHVLMVFGFEGKEPHGCDLTCNISDISVMPDLRGKGIGRLLMARAQRVMQEEQATFVQAYVWKGNDASHKLFQHAAFTPAATIYSTRLAAPIPPTAKADIRPSAPQGSWLCVACLYRRGTCLGQMGGAVTFDFWIAE